MKRPAWMLLTMLGLTASNLLAQTPAVAAPAPTLRNYLERQTYTIRAAPPDHEKQLQEKRQPSTVPQALSRFPMVTPL